MGYLSGDGQNPANRVMVRLLFIAAIQQMPTFLIVTDFADWMKTLLQLGHFVESN